VILFCDRLSKMAESLMRSNDPDRTKREIPVLVWEQ